MGLRGKYEFDVGAYLEQKNGNKGICKVFTKLFHGLETEQLVNLDSFIQNVGTALQISVLRNLFLSKYVNLLDTVDKINYFMENIEGNSS